MSVSHDIKMLKSCSRSFDRRGDLCPFRIRLASRRAATKVNPIEPRYTTSAQAEREGVSVSKYRETSIATSMCNYGLGRTSRGNRGQHEDNEFTRNLGEPWESPGQSERPVVALMAGNSFGAKGPWPIIALPRGNKS